MKAHHSLSRARVRARGLLPALGKRATREECRFRDSYLSLAEFFVIFSTAKVNKIYEISDDYPILPPPIFYKFIYR